MILSSAAVFSSLSSSLSSSYTSSNTRSTGGITSLNTPVQAGVLYSPAASSPLPRPLENVYSLDSINAKPAQTAGPNDRSDDRNSRGSLGAQSKEAVEKKVQAQEQEQIKELAARDREVRAHEQAHAAVGGQYAGAPRYEFERGPDGVRYAVGGEVSIDVSKAATPEETLRKAQIVRRAAMAPAEPSAQDRAVAAQASRLEAEAIRELAIERTGNSEATTEESSTQSDQTDRSTNEISPQSLQADSSKRENHSVSSYETIANINIDRFNRSADQNTHSTSLSIGFYI